MRLIRRKSDWWMILAIYGGGAICIWLLAQAPWMLARVNILISSLALLLGFFFLGTIIYAPARVIWDWFADRRNRVE